MIGAGVGPVFGYEKITASFDNNLNFLQHYYIFSHYFQKLMTNSVDLFHYFHYYHFPERCIILLSLALAFLLTIGITFA